MPPMVVSNIEPGPSPTLGDFCSNFPVLNALAKKFSPVDFILSPLYDKKFPEFSIFLEHQDFVNKVIISYDWQSAEVKFVPYAWGAFSRPIAPKNAAAQVSEILKEKIEPDFNFELKLPYIEIDETVTGKNIVIDRTHNSVLKTNNLFQDTNEYHWIDFSKSLIYNVNLCLSTSKKIYAAATGLPVLLHYFNKHPDIEILMFEDPVYIDGLFLDTDAVKFTAGINFKK